MYNGDSLEPEVRIFHEQPLSLTDYRQEGTLVKTMNDTAYVKFVVQDDGLMKGQSKTKQWYSSVTIPLQDRDNVFVLEYAYTVSKE